MSRREGYVLLQKVINLDIDFKTWSSASRETFFQIVRNFSEFVKTAFPASWQKSEIDNANLTLPPSYGKWQNRKFKAMFRGYVDREIKRIKIEEARSPPRRLPVAAEAKRALAEAKRASPVRAEAKRALEEAKRVSPVRAEAKVRPAELKNEVKIAGPGVPAVEVNEISAPPFPDSKVQGYLDGLLRENKSKPGRSMSRLVPAIRFLEEGEVNPDIKGDRIEETTITPFELYELVLKDPSVAKAIRDNVKHLTSWKLDEYAKRQSKADKELENLQAQAKERNIQESDFEKEFPEATPLQNLTSRLRFLIKTLTKRLQELSNTSALAVKNFRNNILRAIADPKEASIMSVSGSVRAPIRNLISSWIYSMRYGWKQYQGLFQNVLLLGGAGVGKTTLAMVIAFVLTTVGILATDVVKIVTKSDLVSMWIGQTGRLTLNQLIGALDGVLLIDEAYQMVPDPDDSGSRDHGTEAITEIVNFLDKYIGLSVVIAAGYEKQMMRRFVGANEGMNRRFPYRMRLPDYTATDLTDILLKKIGEKVDIPLSELFSDVEVLYIYRMIEKLMERNPEIFSNQAGDMLNLAGVFLRRYYSGYPKPWNESKADHRINTIRQTFTEYTTDLKSIPIRIAGYTINIKSIRKAVPFILGVVFQQE